MFLAQQVRFRKQHIRLVSTDMSYPLRGLPGPSERQRARRARPGNLRTSSVSSARSERLNHKIILKEHHLKEHHLKRILRFYFANYLRARTHLALAKQWPQPRQVQSPERGQVIAFPHAAGLHPNTLALPESQSQAFQLLSDRAVVVSHRCVRSGDQTPSPLGQGAEASAESPTFVPFPAELQVTHTVDTP